MKLETFKMLKVSLGWDPMETFTTFLPDMRSTAEVFRSVLFEQWGTARHYIRDYTLRSFQNLMYFKDY
jgi:hypothetical protein